MKNRLIVVGLAASVCVNALLGVAVALSISGTTNMAARKGTDLFSVVSTGTNLFPVLARRQACARGGALVPGELTSG